MASQPLERSSLVNRYSDSLQSGGLPEALLRDAASGPVAGDDARQAVSSLRGYAYQIYVSALAWVDLPPEAELHLEVAEDYAVAVRDALDAVQVKDVKGTVSLASEPARAAITAFVGLVHRNPSRVVRLTFLTTANITTEHLVAHRTGDSPGIHRWQEAARGGGVEDLRRVLLTLDLGDEAHRFIRDRDDGRLRRELLQRIEWRCGQADLAEVDKQLSERLAELCQEEYGVPLNEGEQLTPHLLQRVLRVCSSAGRRTLSHRQLRNLLDSVTRIGVPRRLIDDFMEALAGQSRLAGRIRPEQLWLPESELPFSPLLVPRKAVVTRVAEGLARFSTVVVHGGTGMGKTLIARLSANEVGGSWNLLQLRGRSADDAGSMLMTYARRASDGFVGLIADDVPDVLLADTESGLVRAARILADRRELLIVTGARPPTARARASLGMSEVDAIPVPTLSTDEVRALVESGGGDASWAVPVRIGSRGGHPQLANALVSGLRGRGWPEHEREALENATEIQDESAAARDRLVRAVADTPTRALLHRLSIVTDSFPREVALGIGALPPQSGLPGESFDSLVGPWIDQVGPDRYRISPLLAGAGRHVLSRDELTATHRTIAESLAAQGAIAADQVDNVFVHASKGCSPRPLFILGSLIVSSSEETTRGLVAHALHLLSADTGGPIIRSKAELFVMLRLAQFLLASARGFGELAERCGKALIREFDYLEGAAQARFETVALAKLLFKDGMSRRFPEWPNLLARLLERITQVPELRGSDIVQGPIGGRLGPTLLAFGITGLSSVAQLLNVFERLSRMDPAMRDRMLGPLDEVLAPTVQVMSPWLKERDGLGADPRAAIALYRAMAETATTWGHRDWALALHTAVIQLLHQELRDFAVAAEAIETARAKLGDDRWLTREAQKLKFREGDDRAAIQLVESLLLSFENAPIELSHLLREGAMSASRAEDHARAVRWFREADTHARKVDLPKMAAMAVGLAADAAAETWRTGDWAEALTQLVEVLERLSRLDPAESLQSGYVHRVVRHALLWFADSAGMPYIEIEGGPPVLPPGACSNPEPSESILQYPLMHLDVAWYFLTQIAVSGGHPEAVPDIQPRLARDAITGMEVGLAKLRLDRSIIESSAKDFVSALPGAMAAFSAVAALQRDATLRPDEWGTGKLAAPDIDDPKVLGFVAAAILAFRLVAAASTRPHASVELREFLGAATKVVQPGALDNLFPGHPTESPGSRSVQACVGLVGRTDLAPAELLECCIRIGMALERFDFRQAVERTFVAWARGEWLRVATESRFSLSAPRISAPAIIDATEREGNGLRHLAAVLDAALFGINGRVPQRYVEWIKTTAAQVTSA